MAGVPSNAQQIWDYLIGAGLSNNAAAGILGNIEQESGGNPSAGSMSGGYGLIQWTPGYEYFSSPPSLAEQLPAIISYINANGSIADINAHAGSASEAALYFSQHYERPDPAAANNANRTESANLVLQAAQSGWKMSTVTDTSDAIATPTSTAEVADFTNADWLKWIDPWDYSRKGYENGPSTSPLKKVTGTVTETGKALSALVDAADTSVSLLSALFKPQLWLRVGAFLVAIIALVGAGYCFVTAEKNQ